ncbi:hypothetical protein LMG9673_00910 [Ralstonia pseudosolanacearum]|nr:hypothetical protein LMG9673_00910 [Ralstonia pseudosolanacearum]
MSPGAGWHRSLRPTLAVAGAYRQIRLLPCFFVAGAAAPGRSPPSSRLTWIGNGDGDGVAHPRRHGNGIEPPASSRATEAAPWLGVNLPSGHWLPSSARSVVSRASSLLGGLTNFRWGGPSASARPAPNIRSADIAPAQQTLLPELWQQIATLAGARPRRAMREVSLELRNASRAVVTHLTIRDPAMFKQLSLYPELRSVRFKGELTLEALKALPPTLEHL